MSLENVRYDAFISYRHCELDSFISEHLHKKLESYRLPKSAAAKVGSGKTRIERVFRDEAELPLSDNLSDPITQALNNTDFLIVICTPRLRESQWCRMEIETFAGLKGRDHILLVLAEGEPDDSFPEFLMYEDVVTRDERGNETTVRVEREPLAADCRGNNNRERLKALDNVVLKLCAAIFGLNYDDLRQRHRERQMKRRLMALSAILAVVTVFAATCLFFMLRIRQQNKVISDKYAGSMALVSEELLSQGLKTDAVYAARSVLPGNEAQGFNADAYRAMVNALAPYETDSLYYPMKTFRVPTDIRGMEISEDMSYALVYCPGYFVLIDTETSEELMHIDSLQASFDGSGVTYVSDDCRVLHTDPDGSNETLLSECGTTPALYCSPESRTTILFTEYGIEGYRELKKEFEVTPEGWTDDMFIEDIAFSGDGKRAALMLNSINGSKVGLLDLASGDLETMDIDFYCGSPALATDGDTVYLYYEEEYTWESAGNTGHVMKLDMKAHSVLEDKKLPGEGFFRILLSNDGILLVSDSLSYILDDELNITSVISGYLNAVCEFPYEAGFVILDRTGAMHTDGVLPDETKDFGLYGHSEGDFISIASYNKSNDCFFIHYTDSNCVSVYRSEPAPNEMEKGLGDDAIPIDYPEEQTSIEGLEGIDENAVFCAGITEDGKYKAVSAYDGSLLIFDASSGKKVKELYNTGILMSHSLFPYLEEAGVYVIDGCIFDKDLNYITRLPDGSIDAKGTDGKSVFLRSRYENDGYHRVTLLSYQEMVDRADALLADHTPDRSVRDRYSMY